MADESTGITQEQKDALKNEILNELKTGGVDVSGGEELGDLQNDALILCINNGGIDRIPMKVIRDNINDASDAFNRFYGDTSEIKDGEWETAKATITENEQAIADVQKDIEGYGTNLSAIGKRVGNLESSYPNLNGAINEEIARATDVEVGLQRQINEEIARATDVEVGLQRQIDTLVGDDKNKSVRTIASELVAEVVSDAPDDLNNLKEIADYIASDKTNAAEINNKISEHTKKLDTHTTDIDGLTAVTTRLTEEADSLEEEIKSSAVDINSFEVEPLSDALAINFSSISGESSNIELPIASDESMGVMSVEDKKNLDQSIKDIQNEVERAEKAEANLAAGLQTVYAAGDNLFFHSTKEDYSGLGDYKYVVSECYVAVEGGKTVFLSGNAVKMAIYEYDSDYSQIKNQSISGTSYDLSERCAYVKWNVAVYDLKYNRTKIMVNYGAEALPYSAFVNSLTFELSDNIEEVGNAISAINTKVDGGDIVTESSYTLSTGDYQWQELNSPIKAGSLIEISGASTVLAFYEERSSTTSQQIRGSGVAATNLTWFRNQGVRGEYTIKVTEKSKVGVLEENMKTLENNIAELSKAKLILTEPVVLSSTSEHCLYLDDAIEGNAVGRKYGLTGTQFASYGSVAYVNKPVTGSKKGVFYAPSAVDNVKEEITVKSVAPAPREINILDIGSSYIDIGTITERQCNNYTRDGYTVNVIGTMGAEGKRHEARSGGTWDFLVKPLGRAVILDVSGVENLPTTGYPGTTYQDANGVKWTVRGVMIAGGAGKLVLSSFSVDANYGGEGATGSTDYDTAAANMPSAGTLTKTTNDSTGTETPGGDDSIQYTAKELVYYNPFWNPATNELDFAYYINKWGFATPDIITLTFGSNDLGNFAEASQETVDAVVEKAVSVVNKIHEQLPACKVLLTCSCYGYKGVGENNFREVYRIKNIQKYYKTLIGVMGQSTEYADYVRVVPTMCMIDRENGYSVSDKTLHSSYPAVKYARDIVHPNTAGFNQFSDAMLGYAYELING